MGKKGCWLGIDFGLRRIGIAASDPQAILAGRLETIGWNGQDDAWAMQRIETICREKDAVGIVLGLPRRTDGRVGETEIKARDFAKRLGERTGRQVLLRDERYTSVLAGRILTETGVDGRDKKKVVDQVAAEIILQDFLDQQRR